MTERPRNRPKQRALCAAMRMRAGIAGGGSSDGSLVCACVCVFVEGERVRLILPCIDLLTVSFIINLPEIISIVLFSVLRNRAVCAKQIY